MSSVPHWAGLSRFGRFCPAVPLSRKMSRFSRKSRSMFFCMFFCLFFCFFCMFFCLFFCFFCMFRQFYVLSRFGSICPAFENQKNRNVPIWEVAGLTCLSLRPKKNSGLQLTNTEINTKVRYWCFLISTVLIVRSNLWRIYCKTLLN